MTPYFLVLAVLLGIAPALIAHGKGRNFFFWWVYGVLLGPVALLHAILLRRYVVPSPFAASPPRERRWRSRWPAVLWAATSIAIAILALTVYGLFSPQDFGELATGPRATQLADRTQDTPAAKPAPDTQPDTATTVRQEPSRNVRVTLRHDMPVKEKQEKREDEEKPARAPVTPVERMVAGDSVAPKSKLERTTPREPAKADEVAVADRPAPAETAAPDIPPPSPPPPEVAAATPTEPATAPPTEPEPQQAARSEPEPQTQREVAPKAQPEGEAKAESPTAAPEPGPTDVTAVGEIVGSVQAALAERGYDPGPTNGRAGKKTQAAIRKFQTDRRLPTTGTIDYELLEALGIVGPRVHAFRPPPGMTVGR